MKIKASYIIGKDDTSRIVADEIFKSHPVASVGLPTNQKPVKPKPGEYGYSGSHDTGHLIPPREQGFVAALISNVQKAKDFNDTFMTSVIDKQNIADSRQFKRIKPES